MRGKLDKKGNLFIERAGVLKQQGCPRGTMNGCGDWCPMFQGPKPLGDRGSTVIYICRGALHFYGFEDERGE